MVEKIKETGENYLGLMGLENKQKIQLFELLYLYRLWEEYLLKIKGLRCKPELLAQAGGMILKVNSEIEYACSLAYVLLSKSSQEQVEYLESLDLSRLSKSVEEMKKLISSIPDYQSAGWWLKMIVWLKYGDWKKILFNLIYGFFWLFIFGSLLYFLVATDVGRDLSWRFLDVYGFVIRIIMIIMLILATMAIIAIVSFMYLEGRSKKK